MGSLTCGSLAHWPGGVSCLRGHTLLPPGWKTGVGAAHSGTHASHCQAFQSKAHVHTGKSKMENSRTRFTCVYGACEHVRGQCLALETSSPAA